MVKICPHCGSYWFGGRYCQKCGPEATLIDSSSVEAERWNRRRRVDIRTLYFARSGMLLGAMSMIAAMVLILVLWEETVRSGGGALERFLVFPKVILPFLAFNWLVNWVFKRQVLKDQKTYGQTFSGSPDGAESEEAALLRSRRKPGATTGTH